MPTQKVWCPYCLNASKVSIKKGEINSCESCGNELTRDYLEATRNRAPTVLVTIGMSQHGKTTYIDSLSIVLEKIAKVVPGAHTEYLDTFTATSIRNMRERSQKGDLNDLTARQIGKIFSPMLIDITNFMGNPHNPIAIYDMAGEIFDLDRRDELDRYAPPLKYASVVWFLVSLNDLRKSSGDSIIDLFNVYRRGMELLNAPANGRNILVYYTKADEIANELPPGVLQYVGQDPYKLIETQSPNELAGNRLDADRYHDELQRMSRELEMFTVDRVTDGQNLLNMAKQRGINVTFAVTSSIGQQAVNHQTQSRPPRYRVLDGIIWALINDQPLIRVSSGSSSSAPVSGDVKVTMIVGSGKLNKMLFNENIAQEIADELKARAVTTVYSSGWGRPLLRAEEDLDNLKPPANNIYIKSVGPILEQQPPDTWILLLTNEPIHDLRDFDYMPWQERITVITMIENNDKLWGQQLLYDPSQTSIEDLVEQFMDTIRSK